MSSSERIVIEPGDYANFRAFLEEKVGIVLGDNKQYLVTSRIGHFLRQHDMQNLSQLLDQIHKPGESKLMQEVVDAMTTNETLWFRDRFPFEILKNRIFSERLKVNPSLKIWSAACSSGQEPYSIGITWDEYVKLNSHPLNNLSITGTDISSHILNSAKQGIYDELALRRGLNSNHRSQYFTPKDDGLLQVSEDIRKMTNFRPLNLLESSYGFSTYDVVFCRNVLIYFSTAMKRQVLEKIIKVMKPGGYLFLGASESMSGLSEQFEMIRCNPGLVYRLKP
jgi:chemotaxis protein methyltransferase CheR